MENLYLAQIIAIGQSMMPKKNALIFQPRGIEMLTRYLAVRLPQSTDEVQTLSCVTDVLAGLNKNQDFSVGTALQRDMWCSYWQCQSNLLQRAIVGYANSNSKLAFEDWLLRQDLPAGFWEFYSNCMMAIRATKLATAKAASGGDKKPALPRQHAQRKLPHHIIVFYL